MLNPGRALANQFIRRTPTILLAFGVGVSLLDFAVLYVFAAKEGVLHINQGIGLLNNFGLFSTIVGNAISLYVAKKYYDCVSSIRTSNAIVNLAPIRASLARLRAMIKMQRRYQFLIYGAVTFGAIFWVRNVRFHLFGNPEVQWGHRVFDSLDHPLSFSASRIHNLYTWLIIMPLVVHVMFYSSIQLWRAMRSASRANALKYDLLNPDQRGGFGFVDHAHIAFNVVAALVYIQITLHIGTFATMNAEHIVAYIVLTVVLVGINRIFLGEIYATIKRLRFASLNEVKDNVLKGDKLNFEILKYSYERRTGAASIVNFFIKAGAIAIPGIVKLWPTLVKAFTGV